VSAVESDGVLAGVFALADCFAGAVLVSDFCVACAETGGFETARRAARASAKRVTSERGMWGRMMRVEARFLSEPGRHASVAGGRRPRNYGMRRRSATSRDRRIGVVREAIR